jgi:hypothetical protein
VKNLERAKAKLMNVRQRLMQNHCSAVMERVEVAMFMDLFAQGGISNGQINMILRNKAVAITTRTHLLDDIRLLMLGDALPKIANAISDPTGFAAEGGGNILEHTGKAIKPLGHISKHYSNYLSLKTMTDVAGVIDQFMMESVSFDLWRNALEANMVARLKKVGSL